MQAFRKSPKTYRITWDEGNLAGLYVRVGGLSVGKMLELARLAAEVPDDFSSSITSVEPLVTAFAGALIEWNLQEEDGTPVPATIDGVKEQDLSFIIPVVMRWMTAVAEVPAPLPGTSDSGETAPEASLRLASSSESLAS